MSQLHLSGRWYSQVVQLGSAGGCSWEILRDEESGTRWVLQLWSPRISDRELDQVRETVLLRFTDCGSMDPVRIRFGMDDSKVWFLQAMPDITLAKLWPDWDSNLRRRFLQRLDRILQGDRHARLMNPEVMAILPGRILIPRVIGEAPWDVDDLLRSLASLEPSPDASGGLAPWELPLELSDEIARPIRGRGQELTYLKSLMLGLSTPSPMERVVVLGGEGGLGMRSLAEWSAAAAETEGIWIAELGIRHEEKGGAFLSRLLQSLLNGFEADFYAKTPDTARILAKRLPTFAFLRGGRQPSEDAPLDPQEIEAALKVLEFAVEIHPRMIQIWGLERADPELLAALKQLILGSKAAWFLSVTLSGQGQQAKTLLTPLRMDPAVAFVHLNRIEDADLLDTLKDLLGPHRLDEPLFQEICRTSLGNPGLLQSILEVAQMDGTLLWQDGAWVLAPDRPPRLKTHEDLAGELLSGRLHRLGQVPAALVRMLAVAEQPLEVATLGAALGIAGDPLEDTVRSVVNTRLAHLKDGRVMLGDPRLKAVALEGISLAETRRMARAILKALGEEGGRSVLSIHLKLMTLEGPSALAQIMEMVDQDVPPPAVAERVLHLALQLHPDLPQQARLWEFMADAWAKATLRQRIPAAAPAGRSPYEWALEALAQARGALERIPGARNRSHTNQFARILRKETFLQIRVRNLAEARRSLQMAAECLTEFPLHPEQPKLRLALGRIYLSQGFAGKGLKALEEGLQLLSTEGQPGNHEDQVALLLEMGRAHGQRSQFQRAISTLKSAQRLMEHGRDHRRLAGLLISLSHIYMAMGKPEMAHGCLREAMQVARTQEDLELQGRCYLQIGILKSCQQALSTALTHLDHAIDRFGSLGDKVSLALARAWKARTLAALGEQAECDLLLLQALENPLENLTVIERGDLIFLQGEIAAFQSNWRDGVRLFQEATRIFEGAGLTWREQLARLREIQAEASDSSRMSAPDALRRVWGLVEQLKTPVEGSGSRWLELEWCRAHALLLLTTTGDDETVAVESLTALGEMSAASRELGFPAMALEASVLGACQLLQRGERLGARAKLQDAFSSFQELWTHVPDAYEMPFLGRQDIHRYKEIVEDAGLGFALPERTEPLADWTPTQVTLPFLTEP
jgi:tetratricopeptide (TPR) repeat protein